MSRFPDYGSCRHEPRRKEDKVKLKFHQSNFFVRIFSGTIFTPGAGAAKGLNIFPFPSALVRVERNKMRLDQHHKH